MIIFSEKNTFELDSKAYLKNNIIDNFGCQLKFLFKFTIFGTKYPILHKTMKNSYVQYLNISNMSNISRTVKSIKV